MRFRGLIFDMDGTMVDNMGYHNLAWQLWHERMALPFELDGFFARTAGKANAEILREIFPDTSIETLDIYGEEKEEIYREAYRPHAVPMAGLLDLLALAEARGIPKAVATAAPPGNVEVVLDTLDLRKRFVTVVSPSQGFRGKPHPDLFLEAARRMGIAPTDCLVFEDAPLGIEAARRAGMKAVAMLTMLGPDAFADAQNVLATAKDFTTLDGQALLA